MSWRYTCITIICKVMALTRYKIQIFDLWPLSVTCWRFPKSFMKIQQKLIELFLGQGINYTFLTSTYHLDLWHRVMGYVSDIPTRHVKYFDQVIWKCYNNFWTYGSDKAKITCFFNLTSKCDLWHIVMGFVCDTHTQHGEHFHKGSWRYNNKLLSNGPEKA